MCRFAEKEFLPDHFTNFLLTVSYRKEGDLYVDASIGNMSLSSPYHSRNHSCDNLHKFVQMLGNYVADTMSATLHLHLSNKSYWQLGGAASRC